MSAAVTAAPVVSSAPTNFVEILVQIVKAAISYFAIVFGAGFLLGAIRTMWVAPRLGTRWAELMEMPIMLAVTIVAARWALLHLSIPFAVAPRLAMGGVALGLLLVAEFGLMLQLRGLSFKQYFASRDPVSATVYYAMLGVFAIMPLLVAKA